MSSAVVETIDRMAYRRWSDEDTSLLKSLSTMRTAKEMAEIFRRPEYSVKDKLRALGIRLRDQRPHRSGVKRGDWTKEQIKYLRDQSGIKTSKKIAQKIGRTEKAVKCKARSMGLSLQSKPWSMADMDLLCHLRQSGESWSIISQRLNRSEGAVRAKHDYILGRRKT